MYPQDLAGGTTPICAFFASCPPLAVAAAASRAE
jgi:hypothetical protein